MDTECSRFCHDPKPLCPSVTAHLVMVTQYFFRHHSPVAAIAAALLERPLLALNGLLWSVRESLQLFATECRWRLFFKPNLEVVVFSK
jgi:hypothetical protein